MRGVVKRLLVNTVGAVVQPGREVVEVVTESEIFLRSRARYLGI